MWSAAVFDPAFPVRRVRGEKLAGVVAPHADRVETERLLERRCCLLFLGVRDHDRGVDVEHDDLAEVGAGDLRGREPSRAVAQ